MTKQQLVYSKIKLPKVPDGKRLHISKNDKQIFYYDKKQKINIQELDYNIQFIQNTFKFMSFKLNKEPTSDEWFQILLEIDIHKFTTMIEKSYNLIGRKTIFHIFKKCYQQLINNYKSHVILNIYDDFFRDRQIKNISTWIHEKETNPHTFYSLSDGVYKIGNYYIDTNNGEFIKNVNYLKFQVKGGFIFDQTNLMWIDKMMSSIEKTDLEKQDTNIEDLFINTTLIICDKNQIPIWKEKIKKIFHDCKILIIRNKKDNLKTTYEQIMNCQFLITNIQYLCSKSYTQTFDDFNTNNQSLEKIIEIMKNEYQSIKYIKNKNHIFLHLILWKRLIIDLREYNFSKILQNIKSEFRWLHINTLPSSIGDYELLFHLLFGSKISYPLYNEHEQIEFINNLLYALQYELKKNEITFDHRYVILPSNKLENLIINYIFKKKNKDIQLFNNTINTFYQNATLLTNLIDDNCSICFEKIRNDDFLMTKCHHFYCGECILENLNFSDLCPLCRHTINLQELSCHLDIKNIKIQETLNLITMINNHVIIFLNNNKHLRYLSKYLKQHLSCKKYHFSINQIKMIKNKINIILLNDDKFQYIEQINNIYDYIFYDFNNQDVHIKEKLKVIFKDDYVNKINFYYIIYDKIYEKSN
jgi:zinc-RING finger domain